MFIEKFSLGIGDRFGREGVAQLEALRMAPGVVPVWNKSNREHLLIGTSPADTRAAADAAVKASGWTAPYHLDADHIGLGTVDRFLPHCDFYTIDVADFIGQPGTPDDVAAVRASVERFLGRGFAEFELAGPLDAPALEKFLALYASPVREAGKIYRHIAAARGEDGFIAEVSTDEAETPQSPVELFLILAALAGEGVRVQTIAPKFTGRFNKGVDYVGDVAAFSREFELDVIALKMAVAELGLPETLKISVHSGSDKFSLYRPIREILARHGAGLHLKTAGTNWLEEVIGIALGPRPDVAKRIYAEAFGRIDELSRPYATVIDIRRERLPEPAAVAGWPGGELAAALTHEQSDPRFNPSMRQLVHVGFKVAAEMGATYLDAVEASRATVGPCVTNNLFKRHIGPVFLGDPH